MTNYTLEAQEGISPDPSEPASTRIEAPEALLELDIGDAEVDFFLEGTWRASVFGSFGILIGPDGTQLQPFPGLDSGQVFQQTPDLTFSVWLLNRFFIEASVIGDFLEQDYNYFDQNYILMGYVASEEEFLRRILIGSKDISIDPFPFIDVPEPGLSSLGVEAVLGTGLSEHQLLLRYDNNEPDSLTFIGRNLVSEQEIALDEYLRGRFFKLPDAPVDAGTLVVYIEDRNGSFSGGDGKRYRKATVEDAELDAENGMVFLKAAAAGSVLVYYELEGSPVGGTVGSQGDGAFPGEAALKLDLTGSTDFDWGQTFLGQPMTERQVLVAGDTCLRLYQPGEFSPFEVAASYLLEGTVPEDLSRLRVSVVRKGNPNLSVSGDVAFRLSPAADFIQAYYEPDPRLRINFRNLYPFLDQAEASPIFDPENLIYGPLAAANPGYLDYLILVSELTPVSVYRIGSDIVPGSVQILRNGIAETRFEINYEQGTITFLTEIAADDRLVISFRRKSSLANNGDILFAWGNTLSLSEALNLQLSTGVRWNFLPGSYTDEAYTRTGSVVISAGLDGTIGPLRYQLSLGGAYTNPDTTGIMRLLGMEKTGIEVPLSEGSAYPAATPVVAGTAIPDPLPANSANAANRGKLLYKDYRNYGLLGTSVLMPHTWTGLPAEQVFNYLTGSKAGPYATGESSGDPTSGANLAMDFELDSGDWVGMHLPVGTAQGLSDLSSLQGVTLLYNVVDFSQSGNFTIYLQIGELDEDLDGDRPLLDEELSANSPGFSFNDSANLAVLKVGSSPKNEGNGRLDSEDVDHNGFLDPEGDTTRYIVTIRDPNGVISSTSGQWVSFRHVFSQAEKSRLSRTRTMRILAVENGAGPVSARILFDRITLEGSGFWVDPSDFEPDGVDDVHVREIEESGLSSTYPFVDEVFHPFGEKQQVLEIDWDNSSGLTQSWELRGYTEAQTEGIRYRNIVYYYRFLESSVVSGTSELRFFLEDSFGRGIEWSIPSEANKTNAWREITVSIEDGTVFRDGTAISGAGVYIDTTYNSLSEFRVQLTDVEDGDTGTLYIDELHLTDPEGALGAGATLDLELSLPGELITWGGHPLIHDLSLRQSSAYASRGFSTLYGTPSSAQSFSSVSELDFGLSLADLSVDFTAVSTDFDWTLGFGHGIRMPNIPFPVVLSDSFSRRERDTGPELQRDSSLSVNVPPILQADLENQAGSLEGILTQSWDARLAVSPAPVSLQNSLTLSGARSGFSLAEESYFSTWIYGYTLLAPWQGGDAIERRANLSLDWDLDTAPVGIQTFWQHGFHSFDLAAAEPTLQSTAAMEVELPILRREEGITLFSVTPGYRRNLEIASIEPGLGDYGDDFGGSFQRIYSQQYLYSQFPYVELYSAKSEQLFLDQSAELEDSDYSAEAYLQFSRRFSSRIRDLFLPSFLELGLKKRFLKDNDLFDLYNTYTVTARSTALNLFGELGAYPLFPFYRTDEFSSSLSFSVAVDGQSVQTAGNPPFRSLEMTLDHFLSFEGNSDNALTFENRFNLSYDRDAEERDEKWGTKISGDDTVKFLYTWSRYPETGVKVPLLPANVGEQGYWSHLDSLELELSGVGDQSSYHPLNLIVRHESSLVLPDYGEISAEISGGMDIEQTEAGQRYWRFGLRGGIAVQIEF